MTSIKDGGLTLRFCRISQFHKNATTVHIIQCQCRWTLQERASETCFKNRIHVSRDFVPWWCTGGLKPENPEMCFAFVLASLNMSAHDSFWPRRHRRDHVSGREFSPRLRSTLGRWRRCVCVAMSSSDGRRRKQPCLFCSRGGCGTRTESWDCVV